MKDSYNIKSTYLAIFILIIIELVLTFFLGPLVGIAVLIISLILQSKLKNIQIKVPGSIKMAIIGSILDIGRLFFGIINFILNTLVTVNPIFYFPYLFLFMFTIILGLAAFVILIFSCIFIYREYDAIK